MLGLVNIAIIIIFRLNPQDMCTSALCDAVCWSFVDAGEVPDRCALFRAQYGLFCLIVSVVFVVVAVAMRRWHTLSMYLPRY